MIDTIYIENEISDKDRTKKILSFFPKAKLIFIDRYTEVFNKNSQNFRMQKIKPALILAKKYNGFLKKTPRGYGIGRKYNYYFAHMVNCIFDCRYCFLQGMFKSANYIVFVNYEDLFIEIEKAMKNCSFKSTFFSGYDCDSLASESYTGFIEEALFFFKNNIDAELEIRTKSTYIKPFLNNSITNCVVAYSFTPEEFSKKYEIGVPSVEKRLRTILKIIDLGWRVGLRFDPIIVEENWEYVYKNLFEKIFNYIPDYAIHSVTYGTIRFPDKVFRNIEKLYPEEKLFFSESLRRINYKDDYYRIVDEKILNFCYNNLLRYIDKDKVYSYHLI